jgi:hypothetical protein
VIKIRERVIINVDLQARVRSASRSTKRNQLTLARERQTKQNYAFIGQSKALTTKATKVHEGNA